MIAAAQGSDLWLMQRRGHLSASRLHDAVARNKPRKAGELGAYTAKRDELMWTLIEERLTGAAASTFVSPAMQWGIDTEPQAKAAYGFLADREVVDAPYVPHPELPMTGASPDGLIGDDGLLEIKCPTTRTHLQTLAARAVPDRYIVQMQWQMECTGRQWCDFMTYDPRLPPEYQAWITTVPRDPEMISRLREEVQRFESELTTIINNIKR